MADKEIQKQQNETALAVPDVFSGTDGIDMDTDLLIIPTLHVWQATSEESERYPAIAASGAKIGDLFDSIEMRPMLSPKFIPALIRRSWVKFTKAEGFVYKHFDKLSVPAEDLEWGDDNTPPAATETFEVVAVFEGETMPHVIRFKSTSYKAGKLLVNAEHHRRSKGHGPGLYELQTQKVKGSQGVYATISAQLLGNPPADLLGIAAEAATSFANYGRDESIRAADEGAEFVTGDDADIPI